MSGTDTAGMVPSRYDVVIDGYGYITARAVDPNMPFRVQQQMLSYSPTFVERQNVSNSYGDNAQDFFLTIRQRDWSLGEQQKFFRAGNDGRDWMGSNIDVRTAGQVSLRQQLKTLTFAGAVRACLTRQFGATQVVAASATNLYQVDQTGAITDLGAHGLGAAPAATGIAADSRNVYLSTTAAGTVGVRKWNGAAFSTFSASGADSLEYLNNTLYGFRASSGDLVQWDTAGTLTSLFPWKDADGTARAGTFGRVESYGGQLLAVWSDGANGAEMWVYDGVGTKLLAVFANNFYARDVCVAFGIVFIAGGFVRPVNASATNVSFRPAIYFYAGGELGLLWQADTWGAGGSTATNLASVVSFDNGVVFNDDTTGRLMFYNPAAGGVSALGSYTTAGDTPFLAASQRSLVHTRNQTAGYFYPDMSAVPASGYVVSSLIDFDSSLTKVLRGVTVEFESASDGNGGTVDVAYQLNSLAGAYTSLATGVTSGTEILFPASTSAHAVSIKVTLNKGTSTAGPILKSCSVRGAPVLPPYRLNEYILDLGGDSSSQNPVVLRDAQTPHPLSGEQMHANLVAAIQAQIPIQVTDRSGTFSAMPEPENCEFDLTRPSQWYARLRLREV